jgi:hypothetical protein
MCWNRPCLCDDVSMPVPIINPPVKPNKKARNSIHEELFILCLRDWMTYQLLNRPFLVEWESSNRVDLKLPRAVPWKPRAPHEQSAKMRNQSIIRQIKWRNSLPKCFMYFSFSVNFQDIHQIDFDIEQSLFVFGLPETDSLPSWTSCAHGSVSTLLIPFSYLKVKWN